MLRQLVQATIDTYCPMPAGARIFVALSGGADSVCLLHILHSLGYDCVAMHCNFGLRGTESDRDEAFVRQICEDWNIPLHVRHFDVHTYCKHHGVSVEMACRDLRYEWFDRVSGDNVIAVAHHSDDNAETLLLNLFRGTGIRGLAAMRVLRGKILRPLLFATRQQVREYIDKNHLRFVNDSTNAQNIYKRNAIRNAILPEIDRYFGDAKTRIARTARNVSEAVLLYEQLLEECTHRYLSGNILHIERLIAEQPHAHILLYEILQPFGFDRDTADKVLNDKPQAGKHFESDEYSLTMGRGVMYIDLKGEQRQLEPLSFSPINGLESSKYRITSSIIDLNNFTPERNPNFAYFDANSASKRSWLIRAPRDGDRMRLFGNGASKLVNDILAEAHLTPQQRRRAIVITTTDDSGHEEIVWVPGIKNSNSMRVSATTHSILKLEFHPSYNQ